MSTPVVINVADKQYEFTATYGFISQMQSHGLNTFTVFNNIAGAEPSADFIVATLECSLKTINGSEEINRKQEVIELFEQHGLQSCQQLATGLLTQILIGDIKKQELSRETTIQEIARALNPISLFSSSVKAGSLWVATLVISSGLGATIMKLW